jgi:hypothetical protein
MRHPTSLRAPLGAHSGKDRRVLLAHFVIYAGGVVASSRDARRMKKAFQPAGDSSS